MRCRDALAVLFLLFCQLSGGAASPLPEAMRGPGDEPADGLRLGALRPVAADARLCRNLYSVAARFGESWAGHRVRQMLSTRACVSWHEEPTEAVWAWPWRPAANDVDVPPRLIGTMARWEVRCGDAGPRQRCALLHHVDVPNHEGKIVTHFVITTIAGRESVLWRIVAPRGVVDAGSQIEIVAGAHAAHARFDICLAQSCVLEADMRDATAALDALWSGHGVNVQIGSAPGIEITIPGMGFRAGLKELTRLRREERPISAQR
jgi:invasion protein IalB